MKLPPMGTFIPLRKLSESEYLAAVLRTLAKSTFRRYEAPTDLRIFPGEAINKPDTFRIYATDLYIVDGKTLDYSSLMQLPSFHGTSMYDSLAMVEVIDDVGSDGFLNYVHVGYRFDNAEKYQDKAPWGRCELTGREYEILQSANS